MKPRKFRSPKLTRLESLTKGLLEDLEDVKSRFSVKVEDKKGRGVYLRDRILRKDSFVIEYEGDVISVQEAERREQIYALNNEGCFLMEFQFQGKKWVIDGTRRFNSYSRLLNHSRQPNIRFHPPIVVDLKGQKPPRIAAYAIRDIYKGEEIVFDYGVSDQSISWLKNKERGYIPDFSNSEEDEPEQEPSPNHKMPFRIFGQQPLVQLERLKCLRHQQQSVIIRPGPSTVSTSMQQSFIPVESELSQTTDLQESPSCSEEHDRRSSMSHSVRQPLKSLCSGDFQLRLTCLAPWHGGNSYLAEVEDIGQPQTIVRFMENNKAPSEDSVICLSSENEESEGKLALPSAKRVRMPSHSSSNSSSSDACSVNLPSEESNLVHKVLEWQERNNTSAPSEDTPVEHIKIVNVKSLSDGRRQNIKTNESLTKAAVSVSPVCNSPVVSSSANSDSCHGECDNKHSNLSKDSVSNEQGSDVAQRNIGLNNIPDILMISDDDEEAELEKTDPPHDQDNQAESSEAESISSSSDCELLEIVPAATQQKAVDDSIPSGFSKSSNVPKEPQVAIVKPYEVPEQPAEPQPASTRKTCKQNDGKIISLSKEEEATLQTIFNNCFSQNVTISQIYSDIYHHWGFFRLLIKRGITIDQIRYTVRQFFKGKSEKMHDTTQD